MRQSEMNIRELMHKTGVDRMHVTLINDEPHPALIAFADERIKALESEILEQCRINGMGAEREDALLGKVERQSAALKLAWDALQAMHSLDEENHQRYSGDTDICTETRMCREALAAINEVLGE